MPLTDSEILAFRNDSSSNELLWQVVSRYISLMLYNPAELGALTGKAGDYIPTAKETQLAKEEVKQPGRYRTQLLHQIYMNINSLVPGTVTTREGLMKFLGDGTIQSHFYGALSQFAPTVVNDLIPDEAPTSV